MIFSAAECRARAEQKLAQAKYDKRHSRKHFAAGAAWIFLADGTAELERSSAPATAGEPATV